MYTAINLQKTLDLNQVESLADDQCHVLMVNDQNTMDNPNPNPR